jgi:hypothetical protein
LQPKPWQTLMLALVGASTTASKPGDVDISGWADAATTDANNTTGDKNESPGLLTQRPHATFAAHRRAA